MNRTYALQIIVTLILLTMSTFNYAQQTYIEPIPFGDMDNWMVRPIKESFVIGGKTQYLYAISKKQDTLKGNQPYKNTDSPWATSSVLAEVSGITKGSVTVFPEKRASGYAARLETRIEKVRVLGVININVLASGTIFLGQMLEPITDTKNPQAKLVTGIEFSKKPIALQYDYKVNAGGDVKKVNGIGKGTELGTKDMAEIHILLQHRWEDKDGNIYAKRIATGWERLHKTEENWQNNHQLPLHYRDITKEDFYKSYMGLRTDENAYYTKNSKGIMVPITEIGFADENEKVTHLIVQFSASNGGAYTGSPTSKLWIDNVVLVYKK